MPDIFKTLLPLSWRDIQIPSSGFRMSIRQDLVEHEFSDKDGAHVESTGRKATVYTARLHFINTIFPGPTEKWEPGTLYPGAWRRFIAAAADRSVGIFVHPEVGAAFCKLRSADTVWEANARGGVDVEAEWVETSDTGFDAVDQIAIDSPLTSALSAATSLDASLIYNRDITPQELREGADAQPTFYDTLNGIQAIADSQTLLDRRISGAIDAAQFRAKLVIDAVSRTGKQQNWPLRQAAIKLSVALTDVSRTLLVTDSPSIYTTPKDMTVTSIALAIQRPSSEILSLNPGLLRRPIVKAATRVRHYLKTNLAKAF